MYKVMHRPMRLLCASHRPLRRAQTRRMNTWLSHPEAYELLNGKKERNERVSSSQSVFKRVQKVGLSEDEKGNGSSTPQKPAYRGMAAGMSMDNRRDPRLAGVGAWADDLRLYNQ